MSKTIRRKGKKAPSYLAENKKGRGIFSHERYDRTNGVYRSKHYNVTEKWEYHSDKYHDDHGMSHCKPYTTRARRADERRDEYRVAHNPEFDYYDREKKYLGHIWIFD